MKLLMKVTNLAKLMADEVKAGEKAVHFGIRDAGIALKDAWRGQVTRAGMGNRLARTIRSEVYPKGRHSLNAASMVWTRAPVIINAHDTGPAIRPTRGLWLVIPTEAAGKRPGGQRPTPEDWERRTGLKLRFVLRRSGPSLLVADGARINKGGLAVMSRAKVRKKDGIQRGAVTAVIFILVPQTRLRKRLDLERAARAALNALPEAIARRWE